jgi:hypothetical protein
MIIRIPRVVDNQQISRIVLPARRRPREAAAMTEALRPIVAAWIRAAADWPDVALGESRCLIFDTTLPSGEPQWVRMWFEAEAPLLYKTQSGGGRIPFAGPQDAERIAALVADDFVSKRGYRGETPMVATLAHDTRCERHETLDSFTDDEVARAFRAEGFAIEWIMAECGGHRAEPPAFYARKGGTESIIQLMDAVPNCRLYRRVCFDTSLPMPPHEAEEYRRRGELPVEGDARLGISGIHSCIGGVTRTWLLELVRDWDRMFNDPTRGARFGRRPAAGTPASKRVH